MIGWLRDNVQVLSFFASAGMFLIWVLYLHLFFRSYKRQRRPNLLIHQAAGFELDSMCMIANMSASNVHITAVLVDARRGEHATSFQPGPRTPHPFQEEDPLRQVHQGPLPQGSYFTVGSFKGLLAEAERRLPEDAPRNEPLELTIRLVAFVGPELHPSGARRSFRITRHDGMSEVRPTTLLPEQLSTRRQRRVARRWLEEAQSLDVGRVVTYHEEEESVERLMDRLSEEDEAGEASGTARRSGTG